MHQFIVVMMLLLFCAVEAMGGEEAIDMESRYTQDLARIQEAGKTGDLKAWTSVLEAVESRWRTLDGTRFADLMAKALEELSAHRSHELRALAEKYALLALERKDALSLATELRLAASLRVPNEPADTKEARSEWEKSRSQKALYWFRAWHRLREDFDPNFDAADLPDLRPRPPAGATVSSGASPASIQDPAMRAEYEAAILANNKRLAYYNQQHNLRLLAQKFEPVLENRIVRAYAIVPNAKEFEDLCGKYILAKAQRERLTAAVNAAIRASTTQPSTRASVP